MKLNTKLNFCFLIISLLFLTNCKDDDTEISAPTIDNKANLTIEISFEFNNSKVTVGDALIIIEPGNHSQKTDSNGVAIFKNLPLGVYTIKSVEEIEITQKDDLTVALNQENKYELTLNELLGPGNPIKDIEPTLENLELNLFASYSPLNELYDAFNIPFLDDLGSDIINIPYNTSSNDFDQLHFYNFTASNEKINTIWNKNYQGIFQTNNSLELASKISANNIQNLNSLIGELRFLRALYYFNLVKYFENPAISKSADTTSLVNSNPKDIYELIVSDLIFSQNNILESQSKIKLSANAATALLGKVYLQMSGAPLNDKSTIQLALNEFEKIENEYNLETNYKDVFDFRNEAINNEIIFSVSFENDLSQDQWGNSNTTSGFLGNQWFGPKDITDISFIHVETNFIESFLNTKPNADNVIKHPIITNDSRFSLNIATYKKVFDNIENTDDVSEWRANKYLPEDLAKNGEVARGVDFPYLRYADMLLMIAEAECQLNGVTSKALESLNLVRRRAYQSADFDIKNNISKEELLDIILEERRKELCYEGHRRADLIRFGKLKETIRKIDQSKTDKRNFEDFKRAWPIPQSEIDNNPNLKQNGGY